MLPHVRLQQRAELLYTGRQISRVVVMSARPGRITDVIEIDLPRPRDVDTREQPRYFELVTEVREALRRGGADHVEPGMDEVAASPSAERTMAEGGIG